MARAMLPARVTENEIAEISAKYHDSINEQSLAMLAGWQRQHGWNATVGCLIQALVKARCRHAAETVFGVIEKEETDSPDTGSRIAGMSYVPDNVVFSERCILLVTMMVVAEKELLELAQLVGADWEKMADFLGISNVDVDIIKADLPLTADRAYRMLNNWYWEQGSSADLNAVRRILDGYRRGGRADLIAEAGKWVAEVGNELVISFLARIGIDFK